MIAAALLYAALVGVLLAAAAWAAEAALERAHGAGARGRRWLWTVALAGTVTAPAGMLARAAGVHSGPAAADTSGRDGTARVSALVLAAARDPDAIRPRWTERMRARIAVAPATLSVPAVWGALDRPLLALWAGVGLLSIVRHGAALRRTGRLTRTWPVVTLPIARDAPAGADASERVRVRVAPNVGPAVVGVLRPTVVVPRWALDDARLPLMLAHECAHVRARDPLLRAAAAFAASLVPWSPAAWWQLARLRAAVELDCDARVLREAARPHAPNEAPVTVRAYGALLLDVAARVTNGDATAFRGAAAGLALTTHPTLLRRRIDAMTGVAASRARLPLAGGAVAAAALVALACAVPRPVVLQPATALKLARVHAAAVHPPADRDAGDTPLMVSRSTGAPSGAPSTTPRDSVPQRPTIGINGRVVPPADTATLRRFDPSSTVMVARMRVALAPYGSAGLTGGSHLTPRDTTTPRDSVRRRRVRVRAEIRDSGRVVEITRFDSAGRPTGPTEWRPGPNASGLLPLPDSALYVIDRGEIGRGLGARRLGMASTDSILSINVLKGERAVQAYGERGRQGVVEITMRGKARTPTPER